MVYKRGHLEMLRSNFFENIYDACFFYDFFLVFAIAKILYRGIGFVQFSGRFLTFSDFAFCEFFGGTVIYHRGGFLVASAAPGDASSAALKVWLKETSYTVRVLPSKQTKCCNSWDSQLNTKAPTRNSLNYLTTFCKPSVMHRMNSINFSQVQMKSDNLWVNLEVNQ